MKLKRNRKTKSWKGGLGVSAFVAIGVSVLIAFLFALAGNDFGEIFGNGNYWLTVGVVNGLLLIAFLLMYRIDAQNVALNENDLEDTEWLTTKRLKKLKEFTVTTWEGVKDKDDEIVIGAEKKGKSVEIISTSALHALIVGTTGSGKTTGFVDQNIAILGKSRGKPSMIIADPKKELYEKHAKQLESEGYTISTLDLREPYSSARWNPMQVLIRRIRQVRELQNDLKQEDGKYYACGEVFLSHGDARTRVQELKDEIFENAMDLVYTLCPVQNKDQPTWEEGA
ncbi:MAG: type IV secretory system conjugative DNA transfer family protein, partial [Oscillospiraceae bacterium]